MSGSMTTARAVRSLLALAALVLAGCANEVVVEGEFPQPVLEKLPIKLGVYYDPEFRSHEFFDEANTREETDWIVRTGEAQVKMYNTLLPGMFDEVVMLNELPRRDRVDTVIERDLDAVLVPHVEELQYSIPSHTKINVFEIWLRYRYELYAPDGELLAEWSMTSYGKTPTAFLQTAEGAVNLAAIVALRDAGANFAMNFTRVPEIQDWIRSLQAVQAAVPGTISETTTPVEEESQ